MRTFEYRVVVKTNDERPEAPERIEAEVRRFLAHPFGDRVYVERALVKR